MSNNKTPEVRFAGFSGEWEEKKLGEIYSIYSGQTPLRSNSQNFEKPTTPWIKTTDLNNALIINCEENISDLAAQKLKLLKTNTVLIAMYGGFNQIGRTGLLAFPATINQAMSALEPIDEILPYFLITELNYRSNSWKKIAASSRKDPNITKSDVENFSLIYPNYNEQSAIGNFFKQLDETISLMGRELANLKQTKQGFLQKMFPQEGESVPQIRFAGFSGDWEERKLGEIMEVCSVKRIHQLDWTSDGVRFLRARDIVSASKNQEPADYLYISKKKYEDYSLISGKVEVNDLLVTGVGTIGIPLLITNNQPLYFKDGNIIWFKNKTVSGYFFYYSFIGNKIQRFIKDVAGIGTVGTYTIDSGKKTPIFLPSTHEQTAIGNFFKQLDDTIALHQRELDSLKQTKKAFLQKMFV